MLIDKKYNGSGSEILLQPAAGAIVWDGYIDTSAGACTLTAGDDVREFAGIKTTTGVILCSNAAPLTVQYSGAVRIFMDCDETAEP